MLARLRPLDPALGGLDHQPQGGDTHHLPAVQNQLHPLPIYKHHEQLLLLLPLLCLLG